MPGSSDSPELQSDPKGPERIFLDHLRAGRLMLQRDPATGRAVFPPRLRVPGTGQSLAEWAPITGHGTVHAFTIEHRRPPAAPQALVLVDLDEGGRVLSRMPECDPDTLRIGMPVTARIVTPEDGIPHLVFAPEGTP